MQHTFNTSQLWSGIWADDNHNFQMWLNLLESMFQIWVACLKAPYHKNIYH